MAQTKRGRCGCCKRCLWQVPRWWCLVGRYLVHCVALIPGPRRQIVILANMPTQQMADEERFDFFFCFGVGDLDVSPLFEVQVHCMTDPLLQWITSLFFPVVRRFRRTFPSAETAESRHSPRLPGGQPHGRHGAAAGERALRPGHPGVLHLGERAPLRPQGHLRAARG